MEKFSDLVISPIGYIKTDFKEKFGIPRQSGRVPSAKGKIVFLPRFNNPDAVRRLEEFSHIWLIFDFSLSHTENWSPTVRPPRLGGNEKVGVFASRSPFRPNPLGLSLVKLDKVVIDEDLKVSLEVSGVDLLDQTPIYDIKPYIAFSDCIIDASYGYSQKEKDHKLKVVIDENLKSLIPISKLETVIDCIAEDPRPSIDKDGKIYGMTFDNFNIKFTVNKDVATLISIEYI